MGKCRKAWQDVKGQLEKKWGSDFIKAQFKMDLGPQFDKLEDGIGALTDDVKKLEKLVDEMVARKEKLRTTRHEAYATMESYGKIVKHKAKQEKSADGAQWDKFEIILTGALDGEVAALNRAIDGVIGKLKVAGWNK